MHGRQLATLVVVLAAGCGSTPSPADAFSTGAAACTAFEGKVYTTPVDLECGLTPSGPAMCPWTLTFTAETAQYSIVMWRHSDVGEQMHVTCNGDVLTSDRAYIGHYSPASDTIMWDGHGYVGPH